MDTLLADDLPLLLLDDDSGKLTGTSELDTGIGGAVLAELALDGCVEVTKGEGMWARARVVATDAPPPKDPFPVESVALVRAKQRTAQDFVTRLGKKRRDVLLDRLPQHGVLVEQEHRVLGPLPGRRWPTVDATHEDVVQRRLADLLIRGGRPEPRTAALVTVLSALDFAHKVLDLGGLSKRDVRNRAKQIADGDWTPKAERDAIAAAQGGVTAAVAAAG